MSNLALVYDLKDNDEINKLNEFCRYENISIDYYLVEKKFQKISDFIVRKNVSKIFLSDAKVLDDDLYSFTEKIISLHKINIPVLCASYDFPDPFQLAIRTLSYNGKDPQRINKIKDSVNKKASRGQVLGKIPYGYKKTQSGFFQENIDQSKNVKKIFDLYNNNFNLSEISRELSITSFDENWSPQKIKHILQNDFYTGVYRRYSVVIPNSHIALITKTDFDLANNRLKNNNKRIYSKNFWNGIIYCGNCGEKFFITNHKNSWKNNGIRKIKNYKYYNCSNITSDNTNCKKKINFEKLNDLLDKKIDKNLIIDNNYEDSYIYKIISQLTNSKIYFNEFIEKFENYSSNKIKKDSYIKKIFVKQNNKELIVSID